MVYLTLQKRPYIRPKKLPKTVLEPILHKESISGLTLAVGVRQHIVFDAILELSKPQHISVIKTLLSLSFTDDIL